MDTLKDLMKHIYPILNYRYINKLQTLISSECTPIDLQNLDELLSGRILESCENSIVVFKSRKYNYRMKEFVKKVEWKSGKSNKMLTWEVQDSMIHAFVLFFKSRKTR